MFTLFCLKTLSVLVFAAKAILFRIKRSFAVKAVLFCTRKVFAVLQYLMLVTAHFLYGLLLRLPWLHRLLKKVFSGRNKPEIVKNESFFHRMKSCFLARIEEKHPFWFIVYGEYSKDIKTIISFTNRVLSVKDYCIERGYNYRCIEPEDEGIVCLPEYFNTCVEEIQTHKIKEIYLAEPHNVIVRSESSALKADNVYLLDSLAQDDGRLLIFIGGLVYQNGNKIYFKRKSVDGKIEKGIFLLGFASFNYYHLLIEIFSRLQYIDAYSEYDEYPILIDEVVTKTPQYMEALNALNTKNRELIIIPKDKSYLVRHLVYPSYNTFMPINVKKVDMIRPSDFVMAASCINNIRTPVLNKEYRQNRCFYISRRNTKFSRLKNDDEIACLFRKYGFEILFPEEMSFHEQVDAFASARCIVATSGAAMTNVVFCQPSTIVASIVPMEHHFYAYSTIAKMVGAVPMFLKADIVKKTAFNAMDEFRLDVKYCEEFIQRYSDKRE